METNLIMKEMEHNEMDMNNQEKASEILEWTVLDREENALELVTWAEMIDKEIVSNDSSERKSHLCKSMYPADELVDEKEQRKRRIRCRNFLCLFILASALLFPFSFVSLNIFINCHKEHVARITLAQDDEPFSAMNAPSNTSGLKRINKADVEMNLSSLKIPEKNSKQLKENVSSGTTSFSFKNFSKKKSEKGEEGKRKIDENFHQQCTLPSCILFGTIFASLLTYCFIVGLTCTNVLN